MSEKPKRRFWQFHLSTVVTMTFAGAAWIGVNFIPFTVDLPQRRLTPFVEESASGTVRGLPFSWIEWQLTPNKRDWIVAVVPWAIAADGAVGIFAVLATGVLLEKSYREARHP